MSDETYPFDEVLSMVADGQDPAFANIDLMTEAQLLAYRDALKEAKEDNVFYIGRIKTQLELAKERQIAGIKVDPHWRLRAKAALRHKGRGDQMYANELGRVAARLHEVRMTEAEEGPSFEERFVKAAKRKLTGE